MAFTVSIEHGNHKITAPMHALPRVGDAIRCAFPASGVPRLHLRVSSVRFHQGDDFEGRECHEPFDIVIATEEDPDPGLREANRVAMARVLQR